MHIYQSAAFALEGHKGIGGGDITIEVNGCNGNSSGGPCYSTNGVTGTEPRVALCRQGREGPR
jgi:hypothetical protein